MRQVRAALAPFSFYCHKLSGTVEGPASGKTITEVALSGNGANDDARNWNGYAAALFDTARLFHDPHLFLIF